MESVRKTLDRFADRQGWSERTMLTLLIRFIDEQSSVPGNTLVVFLPWLQDQVDMENEEGDEE